MQVFDFDKTIYKNDSATDFYFFCLLRFPYLLLLLPYQAVLALLWAEGILSRGQFKAGFFCFLRFVPDARALARKFWQTHKKGIFPWYAEVQKVDDIVISASPRFLLEPICEELHIQTLFATEMNDKTGHITGENCYNKEKARRFTAQYPNAVIEAFYSDSYSDQPMADLAQKSYLIKKGELCDWK